MNHDLPTPSSNRTPLQIEQDHNDIFSSIDRIRKRNDSFLGSLSLSSAERRALEIVDEKNLAAIGDALDGRNAAIRALALGQARMVEQVTDILVQKTLSTIRADVADHVTVEALRLRTRIDANSQAFYQHVMDSLEKAKQFPPIIREHCEAECIAALDDWSRMIGRIRNDFTALVTSD